MTAGLSLFAVPRKRTPEEMMQYLFRAMAGGGYICYEHDFGLDHRLYDWWARLNHILNRARPRMKTRRVLPDGAGIRWEDGDTWTIWTFKDHQLEVPAGAHVEALEGDSSKRMAAAAAAALPAWGVYVVAPVG